MHYRKVQYIVFATDRNWIGKAKGGKRNIDTPRQLSHGIFSKKQSEKLTFFWFDENEPTF